MLASITFATLSALAPYPAPQQPMAPVSSAPARTVTPPLLPRAIASFGAARLGGWLYVHGGHVGRAHAHTRDNVVGDFYRINLVDHGSIESLPTAPALQGTALVAFDGALYRVGGMSARNAPGETEDLHSTASVARFDPEARAWSELTPLPEPRSSHDAFVVGNHLYVVGGWNLEGSGDGDWLETAWRADLTNGEALTWQALAAPPVVRRAVAVTALGDRLAVLGGLDWDDEMVAATWIYDPAADSWTEGPAFPGPGFGLAAIPDGDTLLASGMDGIVRRLDAEASAWEPVTSLFLPRFFHRLAVLDDGTLLAVGGAGQGGHLRTCEIAALEPETTLLQEWRVPVPSPARNRHGLLVDGTSLTLFGGNRSLRQHDFGPEQFCADAYRLDLPAMRATALPDFPRAQQSFVVAQWPGDGHQGALHGRRPVVENLIVGGFAHDGSVARSHAEAWRFDTATSTFEALPASLPEHRTQFGTAVHDGRVYVFGGTSYDPGRDDESFRYPTTILAYDPRDPAAGFTDTGFTMNTPRRAFASVQRGHEVWFFGGMREDFEVVESCDVLDLETGAWRTIAAPGRPRISADAVDLGHAIALVGGSSLRADGDLAPETGIDVLDPESGTWRHAATLPFEPTHCRAFARGEHIGLFTSHVDRPGVAVVRALRIAAPPATVEAGLHR